MRDGRVRSKPGAASFPYLCSDGSRTRCLLCTDTAGDFFCLALWQCPYIADSVCVNSRTLDIGKGGGLISRLTLGDGRLWVGGV